MGALSQDNSGLEGAEEELGGGVIDSFVVASDTTSVSV